MTLTETAYWTKRLSIVIGGFLFIAITSLYIYLRQTNKKPTPIEYIFPQNTCTQTKAEFLKNKLNIPSLKINNDIKPTYSIETPSGQFSDMPAIVNVYKFKELTAYLTVKDTAIKIAEILGFDPNSIEKPDSLHYSFKKKYPKQTLVFSTSTQHFQLQTDFTDPKLKIIRTKAPSKEAAIEYANSIMNKIGLLSSDFRKQSPLIKYIKISPDGTFSEAPSESEAQLIRIDYRRSIPAIAIPQTYPNAQQIIAKYKSSVLTFREDTIQNKNYFELVAPIVTADTQKSTVSVYVGSSPDTGYPTIYQIDFFDWYINDIPCGTYALISPSVAFDKIQSGEGSLVYLNDKNGDTVKPYTPRSVQAFNVYDMYLAYYDSVDEQKFLQPIYIISGEAIFKNGNKGRFYFYVPAIDYDIIQNAPATKNKQSNNSVPAAVPVIH